jgi:hypothetical protein
MKYKGRAPRQAAKKAARQRGKQIYGIAKHRYGRRPGTEQEVPGGHGVQSRLHELIDDMRETLLHADGVGLAAPQVGVLRRVVLVMDTTKTGLSPRSSSSSSSIP